MLTCWLQEKDFENFFKEKWNALGVTGWGSYVAKEKMKLMKQELRVWNKNSFGNIDEKLKLAVAEIK